MKKDDGWTTDDLKQIKALGLTKCDIEGQLALYARGPRFLNLQRPCRPRDGILSVGTAQKKKLVERYDAEAGKYKLLKFVPASGAASRMFAGWFAAMDQGGFGDSIKERGFWRDLKKMPFFFEILQNPASRDLYIQKNVSGMLRHILLPGGLHYGWLPKALILFHACADESPAMALDEHLAEAAMLVKNNRGLCRLHFTVSAEHVPAVKKALKRSIPRYESKFGVRYQVDLSVQSPATSRLAADKNKRPFRDAQGRLVFRPGGHGALLANLNTLDADLIFVKNIDNVAPDNRLAKILPYKKILGGMALEIRERVFSALKDLDAGLVSEGSIGRLADFCRRVLSAPPGPEYESAPLQKKRKMIFAILNRPLRICGVVRNEGEPGGGPFWVKEQDGTQSLQIIESAHVDLTDPHQASVWSCASYFNPVDMVCCIRDYRGRLFDLKKYVDPDAYLISAKAEKGKNLLAQELPGLWNGGMARWNTVFVELPIAVFNPVKTVEDLLRPQHQAAKTGRKITA